MLALASLVDAAVARAVARAARLEIFLPPLSRRGRRGRAVPGARARRFQLRAQPLDRIALRREQTRRRVVLPAQRLHRGRVEVRHRARLVARARDDVVGDDSTPEARRAFPKFRRFAQRKSSRK
jgi:hypothetical protein